jgi:hypothetical protein
VIRLRSPDGAAVMTFASPVPGRRPEEVKAVLLGALRARLRSAKVVRDGPAQVGRRMADSFELSGKRTRALALVDSTPYRTYAFTLLTPARPSRKRQAQAAQILATVQLTKPVASKR